MPLNFKEEAGIGYLTFDNPDGKMNVLKGDVLKKAHEMLDDLATKSLDALIIQSAKPGCFIAGADIKEIEAIVEINDAQEKAKYGQDLMNKIENLKYPTIAVIDGVALGGGCELILSCTYRVCTFNDKVKIGLPEVNLGFVPGFGGCYRLPKVVGLQESLKMILAGKPIDYKKAYRIGLVDRVFAQKSLDRELPKFIHEIIPNKKNRPKLPKPKKGMAGFLDNNFLGQLLVISQSRKSVKKLTKGFYPAPMAAIDLIEKIYSQPRESSLAQERLAFAKLAIGYVSKSLVKCFYLSEKYRKLQLPGLENVQPKSVTRCGVIGAGIMGGGIAQLTSYKGVFTRMKDINHDGIAMGLRAAKKVYDGLVKRRRISKADATVMLDRITPTLDYSGFEYADVIIEAVVENLEVKEKIFAEISEGAKPEAILATNTSSLSVTKMAEAARDPSKVIGFHFFNPVHRMPLIEIIKTKYTSDETLVTAVDWAKKLGKTPVVVNDAAGFLVNRILLAYINEAGRLLHEGCKVDKIDKVMTDFGMPMGPFTLSDEVGLDVGVKVLKILEESFGGHFKPVEVFEKVYGSGLLGKKGGKGFYIHKGKRELNSEIPSMVTINGQGVSKEESLNRMLFIMINEAAKCIEEGVASEPDDIDIGMIFGTGFPPFHAGLMNYGKSIGWDKIVDAMTLLESRYQDGRFKPAQYLVGLAKG